MQQSGISVGASVDFLEPLNTTITIGRTACLHTCEHRCTLVDTLSDLRAGYSINIYSPEENIVANALLLTNTTLMRERCSKRITDYTY